MKLKLTQNKEALIDEEDYENLSKFKWHARKGKTNNTWYAGRSFKKFKSKSRGGYRILLMHREILQPKKWEVVDHKNGNGLDNRRSNIRICTIQQNLRNAKAYAGSTSKYRGVSWHKDSTLKNGGKWCARITLGPKRTKRLGLFKTEIEAAKAYDKAAKQIFGEYAKFNLMKG